MFAEREPTRFLGAHPKDKAQIAVEEEFRYRGPSECRTVCGRGVGGLFHAPLRRARTRLGP